MPKQILEPKPRDGTSPGRVVFPPGTDPGLPESDSRPRKTVAPARPAGTRGAARQETLARDRYRVVLSCHRGVDPD